VKVWLALSPILLIACSAALGDNNGQSPPREVAYCQLLSNPSAYLGKRVMVRAIFSYGFEVQMLKSPVCCPQVEPQFGVEFDLADNRSEKLLHKLDKGMGVALAVFVGRFDRVSNVSSQLPSGERFQLSVDRIEKVEKSVWWGQGTGPAWVPKDCRETGTKQATDRK
jgi:hypothetical protein